MVIEGLQLSENLYKFLLLNTVQHYRLIVGKNFFQFTFSLEFSHPLEFRRGLHYTPC